MHDKAKPEPVNDIEKSPMMHEQLVRHEGLYLRAYFCPAGKLTIGIGHNLEANPIPDLGKGSIITKDRALRILSEDMEKYARDLDRYLPWWRNLDCARQAVLLDMAFNLGIRGLLTFRNTLESVRIGAYDAAADRMLESKWAKQVKTRAVTLSRQMRTGEWQGGGNGRA